MPDFAIERGCAGTVCGVDEAGRGPLAGPVVAAAVILDRRRLPKALRQGLDDSKKLPAEEREEFARLLRRCAGAEIGIGAASVIEIVPEGEFVTYGIGVPLMKMRDPAIARGRAPAA